MSKAILSVLFCLVWSCVQIVAGQDIDPSETKPLEVILGQDLVEYIDFAPHTKVQIANPAVLDIIMVPAKREILFRPKAPGETTVFIRNTVGDIRARYSVKVSSHNKSKIVKDLKEYLGDIEGLEIGIKGDEVYVGGKIVVPTDIGRVFTILEKYKDVVFLVELSPQTQQIIARRMQDEIQKNGMKNVTVRVVNSVYWLEGIVDSQAKRQRAEMLAIAYMPAQIKSLGERTDSIMRLKVEPIQNFINVNEESKPQPLPKLVKIMVQFVELTKDYNKVFGFKWVPLLAGDGGSINIGKTASGGVSTSSQGTLAATISNLFPRLASAKSAGFARVIQSGVIITKDTTKAVLKKKSDKPFALGTGEFTKSQVASAGFSIEVTPKILQEEKIDLALGISVSSNAGEPPETLTNDISTSLVVKSKDTAVVGGVVINKSSNAFDRDPPFGTAKFDEEQQNVPLFSFLRSKSFISNRSQFVFFVTPELIESASDGSEEIKRKFRQRTN
ncbi:MAG: pilus assembly protein N-terminal domain-containing protein [Bdellovibrio sp.]|nr:pilus assembly protein N-terminal domain-containing protein [Bdellovibrio sp.]